jgi:hypothetical protein
MGRMMQLKNVKSQLNNPWLSLSKCGAMAGC